MTTIHETADLEGSSARNLRSATPRSYTLWSTTFVALYVALDAVSFLFLSGPLPVTPWNPQAGLAVALVMAGGPRYAPPVLVATVLAELALRRHLAGIPVAIVLGVGLGLAYVLTGSAARRLMGDDPIERVAALRGFLGAITAGTAVSALVYVVGHAFDEPAGTAYLADFLRMWLGDLVGCAATAPMVLVAVTASGQTRWHDWAGELAWFVAVLCALLVLIFGIEPVSGHTLFYLLFVPLIALAMRRGFTGAAVGTATLQAALILALVASGQTPQAATEFQLLMLVLAITTLLLGAVASERRRALSELARRSAELRAQQAALADAMRVASASEMASALAHELSQPLSAIGSYARAGIEMLRRGSGTTADVGAALERVEREAERTSEVVRRIRDFFRTGTSHLESAPVGALVQAAVLGVRDRVESQRVYLQTEIAADLPHVLADRIQIGTVLHNLLINALDAVAQSDAAQRVRVVAARIPGDAIAIDVEDSGPGIPPALRTTLFEPLATTKPTGMGLGLAISRTIVQAHGGQLWLAREAPTTFRFTLPVHGSAA